MATDFSSLKRSRDSFMSTLTTEMGKLNKTVVGESDDNRFWVPDVDKAGNGYAVIRFLPAPANEDVPFVRLWDHGFQGPGGWYIEKSLTTLGKNDPVSEYNTQLWNSGIEANKEIVRKQKRRLYFVSNIYVVNDPAHPENNGKVFLYRYGKKIFDKINDIMNPQFQDEKPINPFDLWEGASLKLKIRNVEGYRNYDKSEFDRVAPLLEDDEQLEKIWKSEHSLQEFLNPKNFKSYEELKAKLTRVLALEGGIPSASGQSRASVVDEMLESKTPKAAPAPQAPKALSTVDDDDDDDAMAFFKNLAKD
jgi:hypothetical protein